jgi:anti-repressor protein
VSEIEVFQFPATGQQIRMLIRDGEPLFCHVDVCKGLQHSNPSMALRLVDDEDKVQIDIRETDISNLNRAPINPMMWFLTESGFYDLSLASQAPGAKAFKRWITHDVLPRLRRTGRYDLNPRFQIPVSFAEALQLAADQAKQIERQQVEIAELEPKAESWDTLASAEGDLAVADAAKNLSRDPAIQIGRDRLFAYMKEIGWVYRQQSDNRWRPYQKAVERGWLSEIPASHYHPRTGELVLDAPQVRVTLKGMHALHKRLGGVRQLQIPVQLAISTDIESSSPRS